MSQVVEILKRAKERIGTPEKWCKGEFALNATGNPVFERNPEACRWCTSGAFYSVCEDIELRWTARAFIQKVIGEDEAITRWNDSPSRTHDEVIEAFDRAIALAELAV